MQVPAFINIAFVSGQGMTYRIPSLVKVSKRKRRYVHPLSVALFKAEARLAHKAKVN